MSRSWGVLTDWPVGAQQQATCERSRGYDREKSSLEQVHDKEKKMDLAKPPKLLLLSAVQFCSHQLRAFQLCSHQRQIQVARWAQGWHKLSRVDGTTGVKRQH